jgi:excisionase family DNA binding protein
MASRYRRRIDQSNRRDGRRLHDVDVVPDRDIVASFDASNRLLTVAQAADACQISERQMRRIIRDGRISVLRFGRAIRIRPIDLGL